MLWASSDSILIKNWTVWNIYINSNKSLDQHSPRGSHTKKQKKKETVCSKVSGDGWEKAVNIFFNIQHFKFVMINCFWQPQQQMRSTFDYISVSKASMYHWITKNRPAKCTQKDSDIESEMKIFVECLVRVCIQRTPPRAPLDEMDLIILSWF